MIKQILFILSICIFAKANPYESSANLFKAEEFQDSIEISSTAFHNYKGEGAGCFSQDLPNYGYYRLSPEIRSFLQTFFKFEEDGSVIFKYVLSFDNEKKNEVQCPQSFEKQDNRCIMEKYFFKIEPGKKWIYRIPKDKGIYESSILFIRSESNSAKHPIYIFYQYDDQTKTHHQGVGYERANSTESCNKGFLQSLTELPFNGRKGTFCLYEFPLPDIPLETE